MRLYFDIFFTYHEACQKASASFSQSALGGLNPLDHRTHNSTVLLIDGGALKHLQQIVRRLWLDEGRRLRRLTPLGRSSPTADWDCRVRRGVRYKAGLGALGGFIPFTPGVRRIALRLLQDYLLLPWSLAGGHFGVVRPTGGDSGWNIVHVRRILGAARRIVEFGPGRAA